MEKLIIIVSCYKKDFFLTRTCVASINYYHPEAEIYLLKDKLAGDFDSTELEQAFQVRVLDLGKQKYGWGAAKIHAIISDNFAGQRVFIIDSDIVLVGRLLTKLYAKTEGIDFVVNPDYYQSPYEGNVPQHYYKFDEIKAFDPGFAFPGYVFNTGHLIVRPGKIKIEAIDELFDIEAYPYYKRIDILPMVDQSLLNYLLPKLRDDGALTLAAEPFMLWSNGPDAAALELSKVQQGDAYPFLIHWAGVLRVSDLTQMTRPDILSFFEDYYYSKVPGGNLKKRLRRLSAKWDYHVDTTIRNIYVKTLRPLLKKS